jgi:hypothetical protein
MSYRQIVWSSLALSKWPFGLAIIININLGRGIDVPEADCMVVAGTEQMAIQIGVPGEAVAFLYTQISHLYN